MRHSASVVLFAPFLAACSGGSGKSTHSGSSSKPTIVGAMTVIGCRADENQVCETGPPFTIGGACSGSDVSAGYSDLSPGSQVTVKNETGTVIGTGTLENAKWIAYGDYPAGTVGAGRMTFSVPGLPKATFYGVEVGHRGAQDYSAAKLAGLHYKVDLSIG